jgi:hypothetical protein
MREQAYIKTDFREIERELNSQECNWAFVNSAMSIQVPQPNRRQCTIKLFSLVSGQLNGLLRFSVRHEDRVFWQPVTHAREHARTRT